MFRRALVGPADRAELAEFGKTSTRAEPTIIPGHPGQAAKKSEENGEQGAGRFSAMEIFSFIRGAAGSASIPESSS